MKRSELPPRTVGLARGATPLPRKAIARRAAKPRQPAQRPSADRQHTTWTQDTRDVVSSRSQGRCEAAIEGSCTGEATDLHHRQARRTRNHGVPNALHVCRADHQWIHAHPTISRQLGWIVSVHEDAAGVPVRIRGALRWLTEAGRYVGEATS